MDCIAHECYHRCMAINRENANVVDGDATAVYAHLFQALAEPSRLAVVQHLASGPHRVRDLSDHLGLAQSTVSKHLSFLRACGLVAPRPDGRATWYELTSVDTLRGLVSAAEQLLETTGAKAQLCEHLRADT